MPAMVRKQVRWLSHQHRHLFHVRAECEVQHGDRQVEFLLLGRRLKALCERLARRPAARHWSCEHYAQAIGKALPAVRVEVSEDGENGAIWEAPC